MLWPMNCAAESELLHLTILISIVYGVQQLISTPTEALEFVLCGPNPGWRNNHRSDLNTTPRFCFSQYYCRSSSRHQSNSLQSPSMKDILILGV